MNRHGRFETIQALRFVAALAVVVAHSAFYARERLGVEAPDLDALGAAGVGLFFTISGFIMVKLRDDDPTQDPRRFAWRRISRIIPLYWIMTSFKLAVILVAADVVTTAVIDPTAVVSSYLLLPSHNELGHIEPVWTVGWTLVFEMAFYLVVTAAIAFRIDPIVLAAPLLVAGAAASVLRPESGSAWWFYASPVLLFFLAGMLIARTGRRSTVGHVVGAAAALGVLAVGYAALGGHDPVRTGATFAGLVGIVAAAVACEPRLGPRVPGWITASGAASYSLYLTHPVIAQAVPEVWVRLGVDAPWWIAVAGSVVIAAVAAPVVHRFVESPITRALQDRPLRRRPV